MKTSEYGIDLIKHFESRVEAMDGKAMVVCMSRRICIALYDAIIAIRPDWHSDVNTAVKVPLQQNQFDALVSWTYNLGGGNLNASTMLKVLNAGEYDEVPNQMLRWNKAGGKVLEGLTRRREAEGNMFCGKDWK